ncbi:uncharacterized protein LOC122905376 [Neovison vison]|uniref:uncharacterized protein LOC122905376 n=1 Tax=Neovison vison TaxID=452646 RepID=UPI001CF06173|nr:uncharacterized protein LOC122905376 [Neogale vison]
MGAGRDGDQGAERGAERDAPPPSPPRPAAGWRLPAVPSDRNYGTARTNFARARGWVPAPRAAGAAAGAGRTCWHRRRLEPVRPRQASSARRRHPRAQRARALPLPPRFLIPAPHRSAAPRGRWRPALCAPDRVAGSAAAPRGPRLTLGGPARPARAGQLEAGAELPGPLALARGPSGRGTS